MSFCCDKESFVRITASCAVTHKADSINNKQSRTFRFNTIIYDDDYYVNYQFCSTGKLYEYISISLKSQYYSWHKDREASKARWVLFLNCDLTKINSTAYADYHKFKKLFPSVCSIIELLKQRNYKDISMLLSRIEAKLFIQHFTNFFGEKLPDVPIFTVHDTFITLSSYKQQALAIFNSAYAQIGIAPQTDGGTSLNFFNAYGSQNSYIKKKLGL